MSAVPAPRAGLSIKELVGIGLLIFFVPEAIGAFYAIGNPMSLFDQQILQYAPVILGVAVPIVLGVHQVRKRRKISRPTASNVMRHRNQLVMLGEAKEFIPRTEEGLKYSGKQYITEGYNPPIPYSLNDYLNTKPQNKNIAVVGMSGMGKTTLLYQILLRATSEHKIVFVVKGYSDLYGKLPLVNNRPAPIIYLKKYSPDVFADKDTFISSFAVAFAPDSQGIIAASVPSLLREVLGRMKQPTWKEFFDVVDEIIDESEKSIIRQQGLVYIKGNAEIIQRDKQYTVTLPPDCIVDFSDLSDQEVGFYGEYLMRGIYNELVRGKRQRTTFFVDEGQEFLNAGNRSIISKIAALIRATGSFVVSTQLLSTIGGSILSNCATQFSFRLTGEKDLTALQRTDPLYSWLVSQLSQTYFVDLVQEASHSKVVIFAIANPNYVTMPPVEWHPREGETSEEKDPELYSTEIKQEILEYVTKVRPERGEGPPGVRDIAYYLAKRHGWKEDETQVQLKDNSPKSPLRDLIQEGHISYMYFDYAGRPEKLPMKKLYYESGSYQAHDFIRDYIAAIIQTKYKGTPRIEEHGESITDITWEREDGKYSVEIETDTKTGGEIGQTELRVRKYQKDGYTVIVISPNPTVKASLQKKYGPIESTEFYTPGEFESSFGNQEQVKETTQPSSTSTEALATPTEGESQQKPRDIDLKEEIFEVIKENPVPPSVTDIPKLLVKKLGRGEKDYTSVLLKESSNPLVELLVEGRVSSTPFDYPGKPAMGREKVIYYQRGTHQLHDYLVQLVSSLARLKGYEVEGSERGGNDPDITVTSPEKIQIEIENDTKFGDKINETEVWIRKAFKDGFRVIMISPNKESSAHLRKLCEHVQNEIYKEQGGDKIIEFLTVWEFDQSFPIFPGPREGGR